MSSSDFSGYFSVDSYLCLVASERFYPIESALIEIVSIGDKLAICHHFLDQSSHEYHHFKPSLFYSDRDKQISWIKHNETIYDTPFDFLHDIRVLSSLYLPIIHSIFRARQLVENMAKVECKFYEGCIELTGYEYSGFSRMLLTGNKTEGLTGCRGETEEGEDFFCLKVEGHPLANVDLNIDLIRSERSSWSSLVESGLLLKRVLAREIGTVPSLLGTQ